MTSHNSSLVGPQLLSFVTSKYLKYLEITKTSSSHTSKSYAKDLEQFYAPCGVKKILYGREFSESFFQWQVTNTIWPATLEALLIGLLPKALQRWSVLKPASRQRKAAV